MPGVKHLEYTKSKLETAGVRTAILTGETDGVERKKIIEDYKNGYYRAIVNVGVLTTGFDAPKTDLIGLFLATKSLCLYVQILGRGSRIAPGKKDCKVLDFGGNIERFGPIDQIQVDYSIEKIKIGSEPIKICPECGIANPITARFCCNDHQCGHRFKIAERGAKLDTKPGTGQIISTPVEVEVYSTSYTVQKSKSGHDMLVLNFSVNGDLSVPKTIKKFLCLDHPSPASKIAKEWWSKHISGAVPTSSEHAFQLIDKRFAQQDFIFNKVTIRQKGKYWEIL